MQLQLNHLHTHRERLHTHHGDRSLFAVHGAGCTKNPDICFVFINPTGTNVSATKERKGIRAPRLGTKNIWKIFYASGILNKKMFDTLQTMKAKDRTEEFAETLYKEIAAKKIYITNLAKCTQTDARPLKDKIFKDYLQYTLEELATLNPKHIITFGNQVSSLLLGKPIKVSEYTGKNHESLKIKNQTYKIYPTFYPVGQGMRNMPAAIARIKKIIK